MKLAEALILRADLQKNFAQLESRLLLNAQVQEGTKVTEKPEELLAKLRLILSDLSGLIIKINLANIRNKDEQGFSISDLITQRDILDTEIKILRNFLDKASSTIQPYNRLEIRILPSIDVASYRKSLDSLSKKRRELETKIQNLNWTSEIE